MSRITDLASAPPIAESARHCHDLNCRKCAARFRWMRRKSWRSRKSRPAVTATGRGDAR
jgi:hypothetical protein